MTVLLLNCVVLVLVVLHAVVVKSAFAVTTDLGDSTTLEVRRLSDDRFRIRVELSSPPSTGDAWLGFGIGAASATRCTMKTSRFAVGRMCSTSSCGQNEDAAHVQTYKAPTYDSVEPVSEGYTLEEASIAMEDGVLVLEFESSGIASYAFKDAQCIAWATGSLSNAESTTDYLHKHVGTGHNVQFYFGVLELQEEDAAMTTAAPTTMAVTTDAPVATGAPTPAETPVTTAKPTSSATTETAESGSITGLNGDLEIFFEAVSAARRQRRSLQGADGTHVRFRLRYPMTQGWISLAISDNGAMPGSRAVLGGLDSSLPAAVGEYVLGAYEAPQLYAGKASIYDAAVKVEGGVMEVSFTTQAIAGRTLDLTNGDRVTFAVYEGADFGTSHGSKVGDTLTAVRWDGNGDVSAADQNQDATTARLVHGSLMVLAFTFLFPFGAVPSALRDRFGQKASRWFDLHRAIQSIGVLFVLIALFIILFSGVSGGGASALHRGLGLVLIFVVLMQPILAIVLRKGRTRPGWRVSHYAMALFIFFGGMRECYEGLVVSKIVGISEAHLVGLRAVLIVGTIFATGCTALVFGFQILRGFAPYDGARKEVSEKQNADQNAVQDAKA